MADHPRPRALEKDPRIDVTKYSDLLARRLRLEGSRSTQGLFVLYISITDQISVEI